MDLTDAQIERYSRQIILPAIGGRGQQRLLGTTISIVGDGPLAAMAARYLTAAGIGCLQLWATTDQAARDLDLAKTELMAFNPDTTVRVHALAGDARQQPFAAAAVLICGDVTRTVLASINRAALSQRTPLLAGSSAGDARIALYAGHHPEWPCAECDPEPPVCEGTDLPAASTSGFIGSVVALDAIQSCLGLPGPRPGSALRYDPETLVITEYPIGKRASCRACVTAAG